ncbi:hypothetical protein BCY91_09945 [Pelobium manganitolerans]|uniref:Uncharacterized protein n=1 Tax=Pelobium manganitolerans TaxID=1842495 RepID=A0A419S3L7_9SPHI|nr:hypothetical protein [Pelobium manganitolerans]RKD13867.1 hypothetical protein BCY91_09945 [Pelobium manganitolerans]
MKSFAFLILILASLSAGAAQNPDSLAYELQRNKINTMLNSRVAKYGQFTESLNSRTGIFGLKTKKDMQKSMDILKEIIETDNSILRETKTLLDFKTYQQEKVVSESKESESRNLGYMRTINKLQTENESLKAEIQNFKHSKKFYQLVAFALGLAIISFALFVYRKISAK